MSPDIAKLITLNTALLKDLPLEEVLEYHPLLNAQGFAYRKARKVKPLKARPINTILDKEQTIFEKLLLSTLEGSQSLKRDSFVCWGVNDDVWQQTGKKLHAKYTPTEVDKDGWTTFVPKETEDAVMNTHQISPSVCGPAAGFSIINPWWGDERVISLGILDTAGIDPEACGLTPSDTQTKAFLHFGMAGDCVMQNQKDAKDTYRIAKSFFDATYEWED